MPPYVFDVSTRIVRLRQRLPPIKTCIKKGLHVAILVAIIVIGYRTKPIFNQGRGVGESNQCMQSGMNRIINDVSVSKSTKPTGDDHIVAIWFIAHLRNSIFKLVREFDKSHSYMKFGRNQVIYDIVRVSTSTNVKTAAISVASLVIVYWT